MIKILLPVFLFTCWMILLSIDIPVAGNFLPSMGRFMNPFEGIWQNTTSPVSPQLLHANTKSSISILFDERDVPHIYAESIEDAIYAQGYLHAANRLFAMDISTRAAAGRLSEVVGPRTIEIDHQQRERGIEWAAIEKAKSWESYPEVKSVIDAYVKGINDHIASLSYRDWPLEYKILSHGPVTWTNRHTALMAMNMAIMLCMAESDADFSFAKQVLNEEDFNYLYPRNNVLESPIIPSEKKWEFIPLNDEIKDIPEMIKVQSKSINDKDKDVNGSNNWAVAGSKTVNGFPLLANDPHLSLTLPNIWYEMEMHTPDISVHGASIPGLPYVVIGFNNSIAWGTTNSGLDVLDWYQVQWKDSSRAEYLLGDQFHKANIRVEQIHVRGQDSLIDSVRYTNWGPVSTIGNHKDMAMKWIAHARSDANDVAYLQKINQAKNVTDYRNAIASFQYPAQNKVFASVEDDIAISVAGVMPLREKRNGQYVLSGDKIINDWRGFIPFEHAPFIVNPTRGYVSSANQIPTDSTYPYANHGTRIFEDYRGRVINIVLDSSEILDVEDMKMLQQNNYNLHAAELLPLLLSILDSAKCGDANALLFARLLDAWNYEYHRDSVSPILFELWYDEFEKMLFDELDSLGVMHPEDWRIVEIVKDNDERYFDLIATKDQIESKQDIVCTSFASMIKNFMALDIKDKKNWGNFKATEIPHLARFGPFGTSFMHTSGAKHIVNSMGKSHGPSWRMIVELSDPPTALVNYPGGQSGDPASPHYRDMLDTFFEDHYYKVSLRMKADWTPVHAITIEPR